MISRLFRSRFALTLWLVAALLWAPIWGQWHGIAHQVQQVTAVSAAAADQDDGHAMGSGLCQVLDHLAHASALPTWPAVHVLVQLPALARAFREASTFSAEPWWPTRARAPPVWI